ncbi:MAG: hypothetical protein K0R65_119 [Crocinitomicaceae bacterium]|jgi:hypothetical protein|nr:hypothetical protein [Crocinitomicaceae bacterium]
MKKTSILLTGIFILFAFMSCKKRICDVRPDFIGKWKGADSETVYIMNIDPDSEASFVAYKDNTQINVSGKAKIKDNKLRIFTRKFRVDAFPLKISSGLSSDEYTMMIDGIKYTCWK